MSLASFRFTLILLVFTATGYSTEIQVPADYLTIQAAIDTAAPGDTVRVAPGTYVENIDFLGKAITVKSTTGPEVTCIDGSNPQIPQQGSVVSFMNGEGPSSILEGFEITNGRGWSSTVSAPFRGGGIYCESASPTIIGNIIRGNTASGGSYAAGEGGGIYCEYASPIIRENIIRDNAAESEYMGQGIGGGIASYYGSPLIDGNLISENRATSGTSSTANGGGIVLYESTDTVTITNNIIENNKADGGYSEKGKGGGIYSYQSTLVLILVLNNYIRNNYCEGAGGAIYCRCGSTQVQNCVIYKNHAETMGGAISHVETGHVHIGNSILMNNKANSGGGLYGGKTSVINAIFWDNQANHGPEMAGPGTVTIRTSNVKGGLAGVAVTVLNWEGGMIDADPQFKNPEKGDFRLTGPSPCIDAGNNNAVDLLDFDFEGDIRIFDGDGDGVAVVDMGPDEILAYQVPGTYATIQDGINAAGERGIVCVAPGLYAENIDFAGKAILVTSNEGPDTTVIDGRKLGPVVVFQNGEGNDSILEGFCLTNGLADHGGGIRCSSASPVIQENLIQDNKASLSGGGIYCESGSPLIRHNTLYANEAPNGGGMASVLGATPILSDNTFHYNLASSSGGGLYCLASSPEVLNCLVAWNAATSGGGLFAGPGASPIITHDTIYANFAELTGGGLECGSEPIAVTNSIVWNNNAPSGRQISGPQATVTYCDVKGGWAGTGNLNKEPHFFAPLSLDFRLTVDSPCINQGDPVAPALPDQDFEGDDRCIYYAPDMGMDEYMLGNRTLLIPTEYSLIQDAINDALDTDTVLVAPGTYYENLWIENKAVSLISEGTPEATIIDGQQAGNVITYEEITTYEGTEEIPFSVEGFTIRNGSEHGISCRFSSSATLSGNIITANTGRGISGYYSLICNNEVTANTGGGMWVGGCPVIVRDNLVSGNSSSYDGGGIHASQGVTIMNNLITGNHAADDGGGIYCSYADAKNNTICFNTAYIGGGVSINGPGECDNNLIFGNTADYGGGLFIRVHYHGAPYTNNTIIGNAADFSGGGISGSYRDFGVLNSIIWGNGAPLGASIYISDLLLDINHSVVEGGEARIYLADDAELVYGPNNLECDPLLTDPENGDLHLLWNSPCIDAGTNATPNLTEWDIDGQPRIVPGTRNYTFGQPIPQAIVDIGADEFFDGRKLEKDETITWKP